MRVSARKAAGLSASRAATRSTRSVDGAVRVWRNAASRRSTSGRWAAGGGAGVDGTAPPRQASIGGATARSSIARSSWCGAA